MLRLLVSTSLRDVYFWLLSAKITRLVDCGCIRLAWIASVNLGRYAWLAISNLLCCCCLSKDVALSDVVGYFD